MAQQADTRRIDVLLGELACGLETYATRAIVNETAFEAAKDVLTGLIV